MRTLPAIMIGVLAPFAPLFSARVFEHVGVLLAGAFGITSVEWTDFHYAATPSLIVPSSYSAGLLYPSAECKRLRL